LYHIQIFHPDYIESKSVAVELQTLRSSSKFLIIAIIIARVGSHIWKNLKQKFPIFRGAWK
jgi:hypothetical protein